MTTLRTAAQQALEAWDGGDAEWFKRAYTVMEALRAALTEDAMQKFTDVNQELQAVLGCDHCNQPLYAATKCRVCGRETLVIANNPPQTFMSYQEGYAAGVVAEREACATFLERVVDLSHLNKHRVWQKYTADLLANCATAIRARSNR